MVIFITTLLIVFAHFFWREKKQFALWAVPFTLVCIPFTLATLLNWSQVNYRLGTISVWTDTDFWGGLKNLVANYFPYYDPLRLFFKISGDYDPVASSRPAFTGIISPILALPAIIGLGVTFTTQWHKNPPTWFLWVWLLIFPLGGALTNDIVPSEIRAMSGVALFEIIAALGTWWLWQKLSASRLNRPPLKITAISVSGLCFVLVSIVYLSYTLVIAPVENRPYFRYGFDEAQAAAEQLVAPGGKICVEQTSQSYILVLFNSRYDPAKYQTFIRNNELPVNVPYFIPRFENYQFNCDASSDLKPGDVAMVRSDSNQRLLWQIFYPNNRKAWAVVQLKQK
jgi:hypothetical protein